MGFLQVPALQYFVPETHEFGVMYLRQSRRLENVSRAKRLGKRGRNRDRHRHRNRQSLSVFSFRCPIAIAIPMPIPTVEQKDF